MNSLTLCNIDDTFYIGVSLISENDIFEFLAKIIRQDIFGRNTSLIINIELMNESKKYKKRDFERRIHFILDYENICGYGLQINPNIIDMDIKIKMPGGFYFNSHILRKYIDTGFETNLVNDCDTISDNG